MNDLFKKLFTIYMEEANPEGADGGGGAPVINDQKPAPTEKPTPSVLNDAEPPAAEQQPAPQDQQPASDSKPFYESMPENWRDEVISALGIEDEAEKQKKLNQLNRVPDFKTLAKNYFESQDKIRSGKLERGLPENPTDEQIKEYREANGIPDKPEEYDLSLDDGLILGDEDQRVMNEVFKVAHQENLPTETLSKLTNAMLEARQAEMDAMYQQDGLDKQTAVRQIKEHWGPDHITNMNMVRNLINTLPESIREDFMEARLGSGKALFNSPEALSFFADLARIKNPAGTVVPNSNNPVQAINDEIKTLEAKMGTDEWYKDEASQKRLRDLYTAQDSMQRGG